jgi:tRNA-specific 2-thiouridylase
MQAFLDKYLAPQKGDIVDQSGRVLGQHEGIHHYTIGQRKGLGIAAAQPLYVIGIDAGQNRVIVGDRDSTHQTECTVQQVNWVSIAAPDTPIQAEVQVRYRSAAVPATIIPLESSEGNAARVKVIFDEPQFSITPGQAAVWYRDDLLLGGGLIEPLSTVR